MAPCLHAPVQRKAWSRGLLVLASLTSVLANGACVSRSDHEALQVQHQALLDEQRALVQTHKRQEAKRDKQAKFERAEQQERLEACKVQVEATQSTCSEQAQTLADLEQEHAKVVNERGALRLRAKELKASYALLRNKEREGARITRELEALRSGLASQIDAGELRLETRAAHIVVVIPMDPLFPLGEAQLSSTGLTLLDRVGKALRATYAPGQARIEIQGHTDNVPKRTATIRNNWELCAFRALALVQRFIEAGLAPQDLSAVAFGAFQPRADNATREGRAANRRIEIVISRDVGAAR